MAPRSTNSGSRRKPPQSPRGGSEHDRTVNEQALEVLGDAEGSVTLGWVGEGVYYARFIGLLSAEVGANHTKRLDAALQQVSSLHYFADASALRSYDLVARGTFARLVLANRQKFADLVILTWSSGVSAVARGFIAAIGDPVQVLADEVEFEKCLLRAAPLAKQKLDPKTWMHGSLLSRPLR